MRKLGLLIRWWSVRWWLLGMVAIVLAVGFNVLTLAEDLQILIMYTLVLVTAQYATSTHKMAQEMEQSRYASLRPIIVMGRTPTYKHGRRREIRWTAQH